MPPEPTTPSPSFARAVRPNWVPSAVVVVGALGTVLAVYLTWVSIREAGAPAGCGPDSGCAAVLASRWSRWFDVPVGAPASVVYGAIVVAGLLARHRATAVPASPAEPLPAAASPPPSASASTSPRRRRGAWAALLIFSAMAAGAAVWFVVLQVAVIRAFCPWCLALHACGIIIFALALIGQPRRRPTKDDGVTPATEVTIPAPAPVQAPDAPRAGRLVLTGLLGVGVLVAGQLMSGPARHPMRHTALPGVSISPSDHPLLGTPDAAHVVFVLADYTCPHCRTLRRQLDEAVARYGPSQLALAIVPVPLNGACNDAVMFTEDRQRDACDLARAALAVWVVDPGKFAEIDRYLLEPAEPPAAQAARDHGAGLVGAEAFERAMAGSRVEKRIEGNVELYKAAGKGRLPKMLLPDRTAEGEADDTAALFALLEKHLKLAPPAARPTPP